MLSGLEPSGGKVQIKFSKSGMAAFSVPDMSAQKKWKREAKRRPFLDEEKYRHEQPNQTQNTPEKIITRLT